MREPTVKEAYHKIKGCLIARSSYQPRYELINVDKVFDAVGFFNPELRSFLKSAQAAHDSSNNVDSFLYSLDKLLRYYDDK